jgi:uncharacterized protein (DUF1778 family)
MMSSDSEAETAMENDDTGCEEILPSLPNEDRDYFLNLIDNPPEPNEVLRKAAEHYKTWSLKNHDYVSHT